MPHPHGPFPPPWPLFSLPDLEADVQGHLGKRVLMMSQVNLLLL